MIRIDEIEEFLIGFKLKMKIWNVFFLNRKKNIQTLSDLEISPNDRIKVLEELESLDFSEGPLEDKMLAGADMWVFGKIIKGQEVYIKITLGKANLGAVCISFHIAEHSMNYPFKRAL